MMLFQVPSVRVSCAEVERETFVLGFFFFFTSVTCINVLFKFIIASVNTGLLIL